MAFQAHERHVGDVAAGQLGTNAANAVAGLLPLLLDAAAADAAASGAAADPFARCAFVPGPAGGLAVRVSYSDGERELSAEALLGMLLARLAKHAGVASRGAPVRRCVLCVPAALGPRQQRALLDAAAVAGLPQPSLLVAHAAAASCYGVKRPAREGEPPRRVAFVDVGQRYTSAAVYEFAHRAAPALLAAGGHAFGAADMDDALWQMLCAQLQASHKTEVARASRAGVRLLAEASKAKRTLSTVGSVNVELECFGPNEVDARLPLTRERFEAACEPQRAALDAFLRGVLGAEAAQPLAAVEGVGGAARVPWVLAAIAAAANGAPLSHMLDGACACALGAAYAAQAHADDRAFPAAFPPPVVPPSAGAELPPGLPADALEAARAAEADMAAADAAAAALADAWNALEAYVLEMRGAASSGPLAAELQPARSLPLLAAAEDWMNEARDSGETVPLAVVTARLEALRAALHELAPGYFARLAEQKAQLEVRARARGMRHSLPRLLRTHRTSPGISPWPGLTLSVQQQTDASVWAVYARLHAAELD